MTRKQYDRRVADERARMLRDLTYGDVDPERADDERPCNQRNELAALCLEFIDNIHNRGRAWCSEENARYDGWRWGIVDYLDGKRAA